MDKHATLKRTAAAETPSALTALLDEGTRTAFAVAWHRLPRGLRLNRLRRYVEEIAPSHQATEEEKQAIFLFLQKAHDKKTLNTSKTVVYNVVEERVMSVKGLEIKRVEGIIKVAILPAAKRGEGTRKKKKEAE
jgi:hypothetical protein